MVKTQVDIRIQEGERVVTNYFKSLGIQQIKEKHT